MSDFDLVSEALARATGQDAVDGGGNAVFPLLVHQYADELAV